MTRTLQVALCVGLLALAQSASAMLVFSLADTDDLSLSHSSSGASLSPPLAGSSDVGNGTFSWGTLLTDSGGNTASFTSGLFESSDWGGQGTFTSDPIDVSLALTADIAGVYSGEFNSSSEFSNFFYSIDGAAPVVFGEGVEDVEATDLDVTALGIDVSSASSLVVGFDFRHNGSSDFFDVDALTVSVTAIPEPTAALFGSLLAGAFGLTVARRPQNRD